MMSEFATQEVKSRFEINRFTKKFNSSLITKDPLKSQTIKLAYLNSKNFTKPMLSYIKLAYWSIFLPNYYDDTDEIYTFMKRFVYYFVIDMGISPFIKCF